MPWLWILKIGGPILLLAGLVVGFKMYVASERADEREEVTSEFTIAEQQADIADLKSALAEAKARATITENSNANLARDLAHGAAERSAYVDRMRQAFALGATQGPGETGMAGTPGITGQADQATFVDDIAICEENTKRLVNARDWYAEQRAMKSTKAEEVAQ